ncbi:hypothetical protein AAHC03_04333 [Spirometra sp. Aus1]
METRSLSTTITKFVISLANLDRPVELETCDGGEAFHEYALSSLCREFMTYGSAASSVYVFVLVLDTDVILLEDISKLWDFMYMTDENQAISMAKDESYLYTIKIHTTETQVLKGGYNGGVLLLNLDRLRRRGWTELWHSALDALLNVSKVLRAAEQDIFNVVIWMHKDLFYPLPCEWNLQLNDAASMTACINSRSQKNYRSVKRPHVKLVHMNREDKFEYTDDEKLTSANVPETETSIDDRLRWYLFERKKVTLLNGYSFVDTTKQLSRGEVEQVFQQVHSDAKLPTSLHFCAENKAIYGFCDRKESALPVPRMHAYFVDNSGTQEMPETVGTSLAIHINFDGITLLEELSKHWNGPISVAVCASDRQAFRLPLLLKMSSVLAQRNNTSYHIVYRYNFRLLRRASAVISPADFSLVPLVASADGVFDFLVWNLLSAHSDAFTVVPIGMDLSDNARGRS